MATKWNLRFRGSALQDSTADRCESSDISLQDAVPGKIRRDRSNTAVHKTLKVNREETLALMQAKSLRYAEARASSIPTSSHIPSTTASSSFDKQLPSQISDDLANYMNDRSSKQAEAANHVISPSTGSKDTAPTKPSQTEICHRVLPQQQVQKVPQQQEQKRPAPGWHQAVAPRLQSQLHLQQEGLMEVEVKQLHIETQARQKLRQQQQELVYPSQTRQLDVGQPHLQLQQYPPANPASAASALLSSMDSVDFNDEDFYMPAGLLDLSPADGRKQQQRRPLHRFPAQLHGMYSSPAVAHDMDHNSAAALAVANRMLGENKLPDGVKYMPVVASSCLFRQGTAWGFTAYAICLGSSYFQRLLSSAVELRMALLHSEQFIEYIQPMSISSRDYGQSAPAGGLCGAGIGGISSAACACEVEVKDMDLWSILFTCVYTATKVCDRVKYAGLLCEMLQRITGRPVSGSQAYKIEDKCLRALRWRLGPYFLHNQLDLNWSFSA